MARVERLVRWRLVLGKAAEELDGRAGMTADDLAADASLGWLYDRGEELEDRDMRDRKAVPEPRRSACPIGSTPCTSSFRKETIERLERDAVEKYQIHEVVTNPEVLKRIEPSETLLRAVLLTKHLMSPEVLAMARELVGKVVRKLMEKLARKVRQSVPRHADAPPLPHPHREELRRQGHAPKKNLGTYSTAETKLLYIKEPLFISRTRKHMERWQIILLVDESGSMLGSVIHSAVTAACLWGLPGTKTHLCILDTEVVDLTDRITDPVEVLMKVQLGGGTDIGKALDYAQGLVESPRRTIVVLITDFFEGASGERARLAREGALRARAAPCWAWPRSTSKPIPRYDKDMARALVEASAPTSAR